MVLKIVAYGFLLNGPKSYLRSFANVFDFIIVMSAFLNIIIILMYGEKNAAKLNLSVLKSVRVARILKPLRVISRSEGLLIAINSLVTSAPQILNLLVLVIVLFFLFAIIGV